MADKVFTDGMIIKWLGPNDPNRRQGAPDFVLGQISFKVDEIIQCLQKNNNNGWVNVDIKRSKGGKVYSEIDNWQPNQQQEPPPQQNQYQNQQPAQQQQQPQYQQPQYPQQGQSFQQQNQQPPQQQAPPQNQAPANNFENPPFNPTDDIPF